MDVSQGPGRRRPTESTRDTTKKGHLKVTRLDLMATPGDNLSLVLAVSREHLNHAPRPCVGYLPSAALDPTFFLAETRAWFAGLASVELLDPVAMDRDSLLRALDRITLLYVPGGNTFVLAARLQKAALLAEIASAGRVPVT